MEAEPGPFILYHGMITPTGAAQVEEACMQLARQRARHVTLLICSNGGDVYAGVGLYNFLKMLPFEIRTHTFGICGSIAMTIYLAGIRRTAAPASMLMLHAASYIEGPRKGQVAENTELISSPFKTELGWNEETISSYFGSADEKYISLAQGMELGIVNDVVEMTISASAAIVRIDPSHAGKIDMATFPGRKRATK